MTFNPCFYLLAIRKLYIHLFDCCWTFSSADLMMNSDLKVETGSVRWFREPMRVGSSLCVCWRMERWCQVEEKTAGCCCGTMITAKRAKLRWSVALVLTKQMRALLTFIMKSRHSWLPFILQYDFYCFDVIIFLVLKCNLGIHLSY